MYKALPTTVDHADRSAGPISPLLTPTTGSEGMPTGLHGEGNADERTPFRGRRRCGAAGRLPVGTYMYLHAVASGRH
jgi:hypothetical protein